MLKEYPELDSTRTWNCDESGFQTDPSKGKVICKKVYITKNFFAKKVTGLKCLKLLTFPANLSHLTLHIRCLKCPHNTCRFNNKHTFYQKRIHTIYKRSTRPTNCVSKIPPSCNRRPPASGCYVFRSIKKKVGEAFVRAR